MLPLLLAHPRTSTLNVLCLGAHCDDIEIGCGGTLLKLLSIHPNANVYWQVFSSTPVRAKEALEGARRICECASNVTVEILEFQDGYLPDKFSAVKDVFEKTKAKFQPDLIFTHYRNDLHQDHRTVSELTWNTYRNHLVLEYEIPKWDGDLGCPNMFVELSSNVVDRKLDVILNVYQTQKGKLWFSEDLFRSILRIRGMESGSSSTFSEAFYVRKASILAEGN